MKGGHCKGEHKQEILADIAITETRTRWSKAKLFALYEVSKSTAHRWEQERANPPKERMRCNPYEIREEEIAAVISYRTLNDELREMSYKKLTYTMIDNNIVYISASSVYRILKKHYLLGASYKEKGDAGEEYREQPLFVHHHWHVDIAYVKIYGEFFYLIVILDGFSRYVVGWELMLDMTKQSVVMFTQKVCDRYPDAKPKIIHDNGSQFVSLDFKKLLRENECIDVSTKVKHPETNGKIERFIGLVRQEALRPNSPVSLGEAKKVLASFVEYYNNRRLHSAIGYVKPVDVFTGVHREILTERKKKLAEAKKSRIELNWKDRQQFSAKQPA